MSVFTSSVARVAGWRLSLVVCLCHAAVPGFALAGGDSNLSASDSAATDSCGGHVPTVWCSLVVGVGSRKSHYSEPDPQARVNPLDSELGALQATQIDVRWLGRLFGPLPVVALQFEASKTRGDSSYRGYLQSGDALTPYSSTTRNTYSSTGLRIGMPIVGQSAESKSPFVVVYAELNRQHWRRNLDQYQEFFEWKSSMLGINATFIIPVSTQSSRSAIFLEVDGASGRTTGNQVSASQFSFSSRLPDRNSQRLAGALSYRQATGWSIGAQYTFLRSQFGASNGPGSVQYPGSSSRDQTLLATLGYFY